MSGTPNRGGGDQPARSPRVWVIRGRAAEGAAAVAMQDEDEADRTRPKRWRRRRQLDPDAEADLQRELAQIEAERAARRAEREARRQHMNEGDVAEDNVSRLFDATDNRLATDENTRRRANIEHLKAAVAARSAEEQLAGPAEPSDDTAPYREDLAQVMRPRRVQKDGQRRSSRPASDRRVRQTPLVLVSEQRVDARDAQAPASASVVRPRRVTRGNAAAAPAQDGAATRTTDPEARSRLVRKIAQRPTPARNRPRHRRTPRRNRASPLSWPRRGSIPAISTPSPARPAATGPESENDSFGRSEVVHLVLDDSGIDASREDVLRAFGTC